MSAKKNTCRKPAGILLTVLFAFSLLGMGSLNEDAIKSIPEPDDNFSAKIIDQLDTSFDITHFSLDGKTFLSGKRGEGMVSIPFANINCLDFIKKGNNLFASIIMKNGEKIELKMNNHAIIYGKLSYGYFSIRIDEVKKIAIN